MPGGPGREKEGKGGARASVAVSAAPLSAVSAAAAAVAMWTFPGGRGLRCLLFCPLPVRRGRGQREYVLVVLVAVVVAGGYLRKYTFAYSV